MKKRKISSEFVYFTGAIILAFATALLTASDLGLSMVIAPAYIVSLKFDFLTFGQAEYIVQGILFVAFCAVVRKVKLTYFCAFLSGFIYGLILDFWRMVIPHFNPDLYELGGFSMQLRIFYFVTGFLLNSLGVMLYFKSYIYPQVYEFFVKGVSKYFHVELSKFKIGFDMCCFIVAVAVSFLLLHRIEGIGPGTVVLACCNGPLIGWYGKCFDKYFETYPVLEKFAEKFEL
jgi:uncharacterized membrane protein YczE